MSNVDGRKLCEALGFLMTQIEAEPREEAKAVYAEILPPLVRQMVLQMDAGVDGLNLDEVGDLAEAAGRAALSDKGLDLIGRAALERLRRAALRRFGVLFMAAQVAAEERSGDTV